MVGSELTNLGVNPGTTMRGVGDAGLGELRFRIDGQHVRADAP